MNFSFLLLEILFSELKRKIIIKKKWRALSRCGGPTPKLQEFAHFRLEKIKFFFFLELIFFFWTIFLLFFSIEIFSFKKIKFLFFGT